MAAQNAWRLTMGTAATHNRHVLVRFRRALVGLILGPWLVCAAAIAPEHLHEADAGHHESTVHRHLEAHHAEPDDLVHAQLASDDAHVLWLDSVTRHQTPYQFAAPSGLAVAPLPLAPLTPRLVMRHEYDSPPLHGPPRACLALRAPPLAAA